MGIVVGPGSGPGVHRGFPPGLGSEAPKLNVHMGEFFLVLNTQLISSGRLSYRDQRICSCMAPQHAYLGICTYAVFTCQAHVFPIALSCV